MLLNYWDYNAIRNYTIVPLYVSRHKRRSNKLIVTSNSLCMFASSRHNVVVKSLSAFALVLACGVILSH